MERAKLVTINEAIEGGDADKALQILISLAENGDIGAISCLAEDSFMLNQPEVQKFWQAQFEEAVARKDPDALFIAYNSLPPTCSVEEAQAALEAAVTAGSVAALVEKARHVRWGHMGYRQSENDYQRLLDQAILLGSTEAIAEKVFDLLSAGRPIPNDYIKRLESDYTETGSSRVRD